MNDPFELLGVELKTREDRTLFRELKEEMHRTIGVLCFSRTWSNPVLWSHYADKHRGLSLGFDILDEWAREITYSGLRLASEVESDLSFDDRQTLGHRLLTTKYKHWQYEDEVRLIMKLKDVVEESGMYFLPYCNALQLREVVLGPRSRLKISDIRSMLAEQDASVSIVESRLAFRSFRVVGNKAVKDDA